MAEIHVPDRAIIILDEIIKLAEQVEANDTYYVDFSNKVDEKRIVKSKQDFNNLLTVISLLGYSWCSMDPLTYFCSAHFGELDDDVFVRFINKDGTDLNDPVAFRAPDEIFHLINRYGQSQGSEHREEMAERVIFKLSELREKLIIRADLAANTAEFSEKGNQKDKDTISKPRLTNSDRTIVCSKGTFDFTVQQAKVIKIMWKKGINSQEFYPEQELLEEAGIGRTSFANVFKSRRKKFKAVFEQHKSMKDCWRLNLG